MDCMLIEYSVAVLIVHALFSAVDFLSSGLIFDICKLLYVAEKQHLILTSICCCAQNLMLSLPHLLYEVFGKTLTSYSLSNLLYRLNKIKHVFIKDYYIILLIPWALSTKIFDCIMCIRLSYAYQTMHCCCQYND